MSLMGIDVGTTNIKAGRFDRSGNCLGLSSRPTPRTTDAYGREVFDAAAVWHVVREVMIESGRDDDSSVEVIGITSMAESGILIDRATGEARTPILPWFDDRAASQMNHLRSAGDPVTRFIRSGIRPSHKYGLAKLLWLQEHEPDVLKGTVWLSASDYVLFCLTGEHATDPSLAARTYAYRMDTGEWDVDWIEGFGLDARLFPKVLPGGHIGGGVRDDSLAAAGIPKGTPVAVCGHDHPCAALALGAIDPSVVFDSMGTAETLIGTLAESRLDERHVSSGLNFGRHIVGGGVFWLGGANASGGSIEWLRSLTLQGVVSYADLESAAHSVNRPTGILYYPYLAGSSAPLPETTARGAFMGLGLTHHFGELACAVLEGNAYQMEAIRQAASQLSGRPIERLIVTGGGTRNHTSMQIKADVSGCPHDVVTLSEATLVGAIIASSLGAGLYPTYDAARAAFSPTLESSYMPDTELHARYAAVFSQLWLPMQSRLIDWHRSVAG